MLGSLQINIIPIKIDTVINNAKINHNFSLPKAQYSRQKGQYEINSKPGQLKMDKVEFKENLGIRGIGSIIEEVNDKIFQDSYETIANYVREGDCLIPAKGMTVGDVMKSRMPRAKEIVLDFIPDKPATITVEKPEVEIICEKDEINIDWEIENFLSSEFIPGSVKFNIIQKPSVEIEYIGKPNYFPADYEEKFLGKKLDVIA